MAWPGGPVERFAVYDARRAVEIPQQPDAEARHADRQRAAAWARWAVSVDAVMLDTETTGIEGHVVELSVVTADGEVVFTSLINPGAGVEIEPGAEKVHKITAEMVADAPLLPELCEKLNEVLGEVEILAWNAPFDQAALRRHYAAAGVAEPAWLRRDWHDPMRHHAAWVGEWNPSEGDYRWQRCEGEHRSASDCQAAWVKIRGMAGTGPDPHTLRMVREHLTTRLHGEDLHAVTGAALAEQVLDWITRISTELPAPRTETTDG